MANVIAEAIPEDCEICRLHTSGDFWCQTYFDAWLRVVQSRPDIRFYGYTKAIRFWVKRKDRVEPLPNYRLVASLGGKYDHLIERSFPTCCVCLSEEEAADVGREVDHDDSYALGLRNIDHFAVLVHGPQPAGSEAARARVQLLKKGLTGYRRDGNGYGLK